MTYSPKVGDRVIMRGVVKATAPRGDGWNVELSNSAMVMAFEGDCTPDISPGPFDWHAARQAARQAEIERLARLMCAAEYDEYLVNSMVNKYQMPVIGPGGNRFILPRPEHQIPLWRTFERAAGAVLKDRSAE